MMGLTHKQAEGLSLIRTFFAERGVAPSLEELRVGLGLSSKSGAHRILEGLVERGRIRRLPQRARGIELVDSAPETALLECLPTEQLRDLVARAVGLIADREDVPATAAMLHRLADKLPRGRMQ
jgi:SOS-response transcriptional repressor LexA